MQEINACFCIEYGYLSKAMPTLQTVYRFILHAAAAKELFDCALKE